MEENYIWHPFTQMKTAAAPLHVVRAKDCTLYTADGKEYIDTIFTSKIRIPIEMLIDEIN